MNTEQTLLIIIAALLITIGWGLYKVYKVLATLQQYEDDKWDYDCARYYNCEHPANYTREEVECWQRNGWETPAAIQRRREHRAQRGEAGQWSDW